MSTLESSSPRSVSRCSSMTWSELEGASTFVTGCNGDERTTGFEREEYRFPMTIVTHLEPALERTVFIKVGTEGQFVFTIFSFEPGFARSGFLVFGIAVRRFFNGTPFPRRRLRTMRGCGYGKPLKKTFTADEGPQRPVLARIHLRRRFFFTILEDFCPTFLIDVWQSCSFEEHESESRSSEDVTDSLSLSDGMELCLSCLTLEGPVRGGWSRWRMAENEETDVVVDDTWFESLYGALGDSSMLTFGLLRSPELISESVDDGVVTAGKYDAIVKTSSPPAFFKLLSNPARQSSSRNNSLLLSFKVLLITLWWSEMTFWHGDVIIWRDLCNPVTWMGTRDVITRRVTVWRDVEIKSQGGGTSSDWKILSVWVVFGWWDALRFDNRQPVRCFVRCTEAWPAPSCFEPFLLDIPPTVVDVAFLELKLTKDMRYLQIVAREREKRSNKERKKERKKEWKKEIEWKKNRQKERKIW